MKKLKLTEIVKEILDEKKLNAVRGGTKVGCSNKTISASACPDADRCDIEFDDA